MTLLNSIWDETHAMLKEGGYFAVNVGSVLDGGYHYPLGEDIISELVKDNKWEYVRTIYWNKVTAGVKRAGSVIQHPYPSYWHPNIMTEHIILVRKHGPVRLPNSDVPKRHLHYPSEPGGAPRHGCAVRRCIERAPDRIAADRAPMGRGDPLLSRLGVRGRNRLAQEVTSSSGVGSERFWEDRHGI